ncbi:MAG: helix-turn-helix transcriptional regulator, partial [Solirubrobacterales bacterium]
HDPVRALRALDAGSGWEDEWGAANGNWVRWRHLAAAAHAVQGDPVEAGQLAAESLGRARRFGAPNEIAISLRVLGVVTGGEEGLDALAESSAMQNVSPLERAQALVEYGVLLRRSRRRRDAREPLREGLAIAHASGASVLADRALEELQATGARPRTVARSGYDALTARERQVARLAADGLSNPEIAQSLFVTRKTVEAHLRSVFRKLDVTGREALGAALARDA